MDEFVVNATSTRLVTSEVWKEKFLVNTLSE